MLPGSSRDVFIEPTITGRDWKEDIGPAVAMRSTGFKLRTGGVAAAARSNPGLAHGVNVVGGKVTYQPVAEATGQDYTELFEALAESAPA